ncbi:HK97-gp10 family putative phage morphogenesis protein [Clostridium sp.]|uniref:HK97-gp10 family putative phage morphogenesis protein n=1 Tax=Clostridium sp. TaxID=1506 RepID=UPI002FC8ED05
MGLSFDFEELENELSKISKRVGKDVIDNALDAGAEPMLKKMDKNVPYDTHELENSIGEIRKKGNNMNREIHLGSTSTDKKVVARAYYQEYGNSYMNGKKWIKKSYDQSVDESLDAMSDSLSKNLLK